MAKAKRAVIIPGNGCSGDVSRANWYGWLHRELNKLNDFECLLENMPDPIVAKESAWIPFMRNQLYTDETTIIIGHSTGACAAMRFAETYKVYGIVLVGAYTTDLDNDLEKASGYFNRPWDWKTIQSNVSWICQFGSSDDPFLPWTEQTEVAKGLNADLHAYSDKGHFMSTSCPEILNAISTHLLKHTNKL